MSDFPASTRSATGAELIDGQPFFAVHEGVRMNRLQWLAATADARKDALVDELRATTATDLDDHDVVTDSTETDPE